MSFATRNLLFCSIVLYSLLDKISNLKYPRAEELNEDVEFQCQQIML